MRFFFLCEPFLKSLLNSWQYCFGFMFWYFGQEACETFVRQTCPACTALEGKVLTIGPPGLKSYCFSFDEITCKALFFKKGQRRINTFEYEIYV